MMGLLLFAEDHQIGYDGYKSRRRTKRGFDGYQADGLAVDKKSVVVATRVG